MSFIKIGHFRSAACAVALLAVGAGAAMAQDARGDRCRREVSATGSAAFTEQGGQAKAARNWRRAVVARYGEFLSDINDAKEVSYKCNPTLLGLTRCELRGRPCETAASAPGGTDFKELTCRQSDSKNCDPVVKWVQSRLNAKGANLIVDGAEGPSTADAVRRFREKNNLGQGSKIDDKVVAALAAA